MGPAAPAAFAAPVGAAFTYQGQLKDAGNPATGVYDLQFSLFDAASGGGQVGVTITKDDVAVAAGLFVVSLDFGSPAFAGSARFLQIAVRPGASSGAFTPLVGRQELTPAPNALYAANSGQLNGQVATYYTDLANQTGVLGVAHGGTGAITAESARFALGAAPEAYVPFAPAVIDNTPAFVGQYASLAIGVDGFPLISYYDGTNGDLKVAHCLDRACTTSEISVVDSTSTVGAYSSIAIGSDGLGLITYMGSPGQRLNVAHCSNVACSSATTSVIDPAFIQLQHSSITIGTDGLALVSYHDSLNADLKVAHCLNINCSSSTLSIVDDGAPGSSIIGRSSSITIGIDGFGIISYEDIYDLAQGNNRLKIAHCENVACTTTTKIIADSVVGTGGATSIIIGQDGLALVAYGHEGLRVARCSTVACGSTTVSVISPTVTPKSVSMSIGPDGLPVIAYGVGFTHDLAVAHCNNAACTAATSTTVDSIGAVANDVSLAIGLDGLPIIGYSDDTNGNLKVAHCTNVTCSVKPRKR
jgi:hypothetical protein